MALIVEDGTGVDGANSYVTVAEADAYYADRNIADWAGANATEPDKEGYLIQAADYINQFYDIKGEPIYTTQSMGLPTLEYDYVPGAFKQAQVILAREAAINGPLSTTFGSQPVTYERKRLDGVGEKELHYADKGIDRFGKVGSTVDALLRPYVNYPGGIQQARVDAA